MYMEFPFKYCPVPCKWQRAQQQASTLKFLNMIVLVLLAVLSLKDYSTFIRIYMHIHGYTCTQNSQFIFSTLIQRSVS